MSALRWPGALAPTGLFFVPLLILAVGEPALAQAPLRVPLAPAAPILVDGQLPPDEWRDAAALPLGGSLRMLAKQMGGDLFLGIHTGTRVPRPVDVFVQTEAGEVYQLHASAQIGERHLPATGWTDALPPWRWGNHVDWIANEARADSERPRDLPFDARLFPADGVEFQIRRARFPGRTWRIRIDVGRFSGEEAADRFPAQATDDPETWAVLELP